MLAAKLSPAAYLNAETSALSLLSGSPTGKYILQMIFPHLSIREQTQLTQQAQQRLVTIKLQGKISVLDWTKLLAHAEGIVIPTKQWPERQAQRGYCCGLHALSQLLVAHAGKTTTFPPPRKDRYHSRSLRQMAKKANYSKCGEIYNINYFQSLCESLGIKCSSAQVFNRDTFIGAYAIFR